jgi:dipeptidase E
MELLLLSNSTNHGSSPWAHAVEAGRPLVDGKTVLFVPYALADHDGYTKVIREAFQPMGAEVVGVHTLPDARAAVERADAVYVGGGNTWRLLRAVQELGLVEVMRDRVAGGMPYLGASAGTNLACPTIKTTNDMPIVEPASFEALGLVPFQINPHYLDPDPNSPHMGETRETRIREFHEENDTPVLGIREGGWLRVSGTTIVLEGSARLFRRGATPEEVPPGTLSI